MVMKFAGKIINGKLTLDDNLGFRDYLHLIEGDVHLEIKRAEKVRSPQQNAYYRVIVRILAKELGYTEAEMHETLKEKYDIESTKQLAMEEFTDLIETIKRWAVIDMGIVLPNAKQPHQ
tara:strand:- start:144 stop:500 length:357 start_codon:yes stop_codon:yes gene_type:complete